MPPWSYSPDAQPLPSRSWHKIGEDGRAQSHFQQWGWRGMGGMGMTASLYLPGQGCHCSFMGRG